MLIFLFLFFLCQLQNLYSVEVLRLLTQDGEVFEYKNDDLAPLKLSKTISGFCETFKEQNSTSEMRLRTIESSSWKNIERTLFLLYGARYKKSKEHERLFCDLHQIIESMTCDELYAYIQAIDYIDNAKLLSIALKRWQNYAANLFEVNEKNYTFNGEVKRILQRKITKNLIRRCYLDEHKPVRIKSHLKAPYGSFFHKLCYYPCENYLVSSFGDKRLTIYFDDKRISSYHPVEKEAKYINAPEVISSMCFSPDGKTIAAGSRSGNIFLFNFEDCSSIATFFDGSLQEISSISYNPTGKLIASVSCDSRVCIWEIDTGSFRCFGSGASKILFAPHADMIVVAGGKRICIWSIDTQECLKSFSCSNPIGDIACVSSGGHIALGLNNGCVAIKDLSSGKLSTIDKGAGVAISSICYSDDDQLLLASLADYRVYVWNVQVSEILHILNLHLTLDLDAELSQNAQALFSPNADFIAYFASENTVCIVDFMYGIKQFLKSRSYEQILLLSLAYQKKKAKEFFDVKENERLFTIFNFFQEDEKNFIKALFPMEPGFFRSCIQSLVKKLSPEKKE